MTKKDAQTRRTTCFVRGDKLSPGNNANINRFETEQKNIEGNDNE